MKTLEKAGKVLLQIICGLYAIGIPLLIPFAPATNIPALIVVWLTASLAYLVLSRKRGLA